MVCTPISVRRPRTRRHQVGAGIHRRKIGEPDVLKDAEYAQLALLIDQGIIGHHGKIEMQLS